MTGSSSRLEQLLVQMRSSWATVLSLVMFPVFKVDFGSIRTM
jgi:hypothetical protein